MKRIAAILYILTFCLTGNSQESDQLRIKGFVDTYHAVRISEPNDFLASRSRFRAEMEKINGKSYFFASVNAVQNSTMPELTRIQFREAFMEFTGNKWGFKAGRQIIIWGKADGLKITDIISPMDLTEFLAQDYDDIRMPVNAIVLSRFSDNWNLDLLCVPVFRSYILPGQGNPWSMGLEETGIVEDDPVIPGFKFSNMEYGARLSFYLSGIDIDISALNTWNKAPVYRYYIPEDSSSLHVIPEHHRLGFIGTGLSKSLGALILRVEAAFYMDKMYSPSLEDMNSGLISKNSTNYLLGVDWYPGGEWMITGQFTDEFIMDYTDAIAREKHSLISTLGISKKLFRSTLSLSTFAYVGLNEGDFFNRTSMDYALSDNIHLLAGYDWFNGEKGMFGQYNDNSEIWLKAKFSF